MTAAKAKTSTAGIIIIGNEILSGKVQDCNSFFLASELRALGVSVEHISVIPDDIEVIGKEVLLFSERYDYVFTSGGVGPTHDDITMAGIAQGFGVKLCMHPVLEQKFRARYGPAVNPAILKMAEVPEGSVIIEPGNARFPLVSFRNVFILPGIPQYLKEKFSYIKDRFNCPLYHLKRLYLNAEESEIAAALNGAVEANPEVTFGSYPVMDNPGYRILVTAESKDAASLEEAVRVLLDRLPADIIIRVE
jgi:molybdenum cofactor synthesis domain-containing protein